MGSSGTLLAVMGGNHLSEDPNNAHQNIIAKPSETVTHVTETAFNATNTLVGSSHEQLKRTRWNRTI